MKKITLFPFLLFALAITTSTYSQKVAVIGVNHTSPDGLSCVVTEAISNGDVIYFTEDEYNNSTNAFSSGESVVKFTASTNIAVGDVIFIKEISTNTFSVDCTAGACGSASAVAIPFSLASGGETIYAYSDTDDDPTNGVTEIFSAFHTIAGSILIGEDPSGDFPNAIVIDGFASGTPNRTEFNASRDGVSQAILENPVNYSNGSANADLNTSVFTNFNLAGVNPVVTLTSGPASVSENSGTPIIYTFSRTGGTASPLTVNFNVAGSATFNTDYTQSGAASFTAGNGTVTIGAGSSSAAVTINPSGDTDLEPNETVQLTVTTGTGYDAGAPGEATGTINNDDTMNITPVVAVVGTTHTGTEGFSFVALDNIAAGTAVFFTENPFDMGTLSFSGSEGVMQWIAPMGGITRGTVVVATENSANVFTASAGTVTIVSGNFSLANNGEAFFAYGDTDLDHTNGITQVDAVLFTGTTSTPGGTIPASEDPTTKYIGSVLVDGFAAIAPSRTEYDPALRGVTVDQANFQNAANWLHAQPAGTLSDLPFSNIVITTGSANPSASVTVAPASVVEDGATNLVFTFTLDEVATTNITLNFTVAGSATFNTDYTVTGANSFDATSGSVTIANGTSSAQLTVDPTADGDVEVLETVALMIASGTGYDGGSPNDATGSISNDDTSASMPLVAITGLNHTTPDGFSFVAARDIPAGTVVFFTEDEFDNTSLTFSSGEAVLQWTAPGAGIPKGDVVVVSETSTDVFSLTCNGASAGLCGSITSIVSGFSIATDGETFYAYEDDDTDPTNGVTDIYAVLYTGVSGSPGGSIPAAQDPSGLYLNALVVDGFPASAPNRTEYDDTKRNVPVNMADFENIANWVHAQPNAPGLSPVPFTNLDVVDTEDPVVDCSSINENRNTDTGVCSFTMPGTGFDATATDNVGVVSLTNDFNGLSTLAGETFPVGVTPVLWTAIDEAGNTGTCAINITITDNEAPTVVSQDITVDLDASGNVSITPSAVDNGSSDACGIASISVTPSTFDCGDIGVNAVMLTVTDVNGNSASASADVSVQDVAPPTIVCLPNINIISSSPEVLDPGTATASDNCTNPPSITGVRSDGMDLTTAPYPQGITTITWTATDASGTMAQCLQTVTITSPPSMGNDITSFTVPGQIGLTAIDAAAKTVDITVMNGTDVTMLIPTITVSPDATVSPTSGTSQDFTNPVIYTVTAEDGMMQPWTVTVSVVQFASVGDRVFEDFDNDGIQDAGEPGVEGITVALQDCSASTLATTTTDASGNYLFENLVAADYKILFSNLPANYTFSPQDQGADDTVDSDVDSGGLSSCISLSPGENNDTVDAGINLQVGSIGDKVFEDLDFDGIQDAGEPGVEGVTVALQDCSGSTMATTTTDASGNYLFENLVAADYKILFSNLPSNYTFSPQDQGGDDTVDSDVDSGGLSSCISLSPGENINTVDAGINLPVGSIGDRVFNDLNFNGLQDAGEPGVAGITVALQECGGTTIDTQLTDASGVYLFTGVLTGDYKILISGLPPNYIFTLQDQGADDSIDSDVDPSGLSGCITLAAGENNDSVDAGISLEQLSITGFVLVNANNNTDIGPIANGDVIDVSSLPTMNLNIRAEATSDTESVRLELSGAQSTGRTENVAPYALYGDNSGNYTAHVFALGNYNLTATPYSGNSLGGIMGTGLNVSFEFVNPAIGSPLILVDASDDSVITGLTEGLVINKSILGDLTFGVIFNPDFNPNGVSFNLSGPLTENRTEGSSPPFSLFGDIGVNIQGKMFPVGAYTLVANPNNGPTVTVHFEVVDEDPACLAFDVVLDDTTNPSTCGGSDGSIAIMVGGAMPPLDYDWSHDNTLESPLATGLTAGNYSVTVTDDNGCTETLMITLNDPPLPVVSFTAPADLLISDGVQAGLGGGTPAGGVYSGSGVTDDGNGMTYSFDPAAAGVGIHTLTYSYTDANGCSSEASDDVEVTDPSSILSVTGFVLVNADSNTDIMTIVEGAAIDLASLPTGNLNIRAITTNDAESVGFMLSGTQNSTRTENVPPYALFGDNSGNYFAHTFVAGAYSLTATPYSGNNKGGAQGTAGTVNFEFTDGTPVFFTIKLYPNPAVNQIRVDVEDPKIKMSAIMVHDVKGRIISTADTRFLSNGEDYMLRVNELPAGVYYMSVINDKGFTHKQPFIVRK